MSIEKEYAVQTSEKGFGSGNACLGRGSKAKANSEALNHEDRKQQLGCHEIIQQATGKFPFSRN